MRWPTKWMPAVALMVLTAALPDAARAADLGAIVGRLTTPAGAPVANATVTAARSDGGAIRATLSGSDGVYSFGDLTPGAWTVTAQVDGLPTVSTPALVVVTGKATRSDLVMSIAPPAAAPAAPAVAAAPAPAPTPSPEMAAAASAAVAAIVPEALQAPPAAAAVDTQTPFAVGDLGWMNGTSRATTPVFDTKFFTPEIRFDVNYLQSFNHPVDHTIVGSTEFQIEQVSFGGDFHWHNVRARFLSMMGLFAVTTPRNDASLGVGQWDLQGAYKYFSEANAGYHWDVNHGLNLDAGIFVSYVGLFSYYNFDNWTYQPSFVSSNTPWFFNGVRVQWFPTDKLKIEPWFINGWQSLGRYNSKPGLGGQILWRPKPWVSMVFNNYGMGEDTLGVPNRSRFHTDDSIEIKYYDREGSKGLDKMALSLTGDLGCEHGGGVSCFGNHSLGPKQAF